MPTYNSPIQWNNLEIEISPADPWRKRLRFWPFFVGQKIELELRIKGLAALEKPEQPFHIVAKLPDENQPRIITPILAADPVDNRVTIAHINGQRRIIGKGEIKYWISNRGYNVDNDPIFIAEAINLDSMIVQVLAMAIGPFFCFIAGLVLSLLIK